jgi:hypothetical protein
MGSGFITLAPSGPPGATPDQIQTEVVAVFRGPEAASGCAQRNDGPCVVTTCPVPYVPPTPGSELSVGQLAIGAILLEPNTDGSYPFTVQGVWPAGKPVHVAATGGQIPAFTADLIAPSALALTTPPGAVTGSRAPLAHPLSKGADLPLAWTPVAQTTVASVSQSYASGGSAAAAVTVECSFDGASGTGTIPASALTDLSVVAPANGGPATELVVEATGRVMLMAGPYPIVVAGSGEGATLDISSVTP